VDLHYHRRALRRDTTERIDPREEPGRGDLGILERSVEGGMGGRWNGGRLGGPGRRSGASDGLPDELCHVLGKGQRHRAMPRLSRTCHGPPVHDQHPPWPHRLAPPDQLKVGPSAQGCPHRSVGRRVPIEHQRPTPGTRRRSSESDARPSQPQHRPSPCVPQPHPRLDLHSHPHPHPPKRVRNVTAEREDTTKQQPVAQVMPLDAEGSASWDLEHLLGRGEPDLSSRPTCASELRLTPQVQDSRTIQLRNLDTRNEVFREARRRLQEPQPLRRHLQNELGVLVRRLQTPREANAS
jgi:hypothetical protein